MIPARLDSIHKDLHVRDFGCDHRLCAAGVGAGVGAGADPLSCCEKKKIVDDSLYKMKTCSAQVYRELKGKKSKFKKKRMKLRIK